MAGRAPARHGRTEDVDCPVGARPCLTPSEDHGYVLDEAEVVFWGVCPTCHTAAASPADDEKIVFHHDQEALQ